MIKICPAEEKDIPVLNTISFKAKAFWGYPDDWLKHWCDDLTITPEYLAENHIYNLTTEEKILGFCAMEEGEIAYEIAHLWVLPEFIGKGYGKYLLTETLNQVIIMPKDIIVVADPNSEAFYQKMGFETFGKKESFPKGRFLPVMRKVIYPASHI